MRAVVAVLAAVLVAGCGGRGEDAAAPEPLTVLAAASLREALPAALPAGARISAGGSDELAAQVRQGVPADLYLAAGASLPAELFADGLVEEPVVFATNELVLAVPRGSRRVRSLADLERRDVAIAIGSETVPVGRYTRTVLARLGPARERRVLANVRSQEPSVAGVVGKLGQGAVDAGFVYRTDVRGAEGAIEVIALPPQLQPVVRYAGAVVAGSPHAPAARAALARLAGAGSLLAAGFGAP